MEKFAEQCPDSQRGKPLRDGASKEKAGVSVCEKKRKKDGKTIYYKTKTQREKDSASKEERSTARKNLGFAKKGRLSKINKEKLEDFIKEIKTIRKNINESAISKKGKIADSEKEDKFLEKIIKTISSAEDKILPMEKSGPFNEMRMIRHRLNFIKSRILDYKEPGKDIPIDQIANGIKNIDSSIYGLTEKEKEVIKKIKNDFRFLLLAGNKISKASKAEREVDLYLEEKNLSGAKGVLTGELGKNLTSEQYQRLAKKILDYQSRMTQEEKKAAEKEDLEELSKKLNLHISDLEYMEKNPEKGGPRNALKNTEYNISHDINFFKSWKKKIDDALANFSFFRYSPHYEKILKFSLFWNRKDIFLD